MNGDLRDEEELARVGQREEGKGMCKANGMRLAG